MYNGWRYLDEMKLRRAGMQFHGPPAKMILMGQNLVRLVSDSIRHQSKTDAAVAG